MQDNRLCMGLASNPYIFSKISNFVTRIANRHGVSRIVNYLHAFCVFGSDYNSAVLLQLKVINILQRLGFHVSYKKRISSTQSVRFLGIIIDLVNLQMWLPSDKFGKIRIILQWFQGRREVSKKKVQQLGGYLAHFSRVVKGGRIFSRRRSIFEMLKSVSSRFIKFAWIILLEKTCYGGPPMPVNSMVGKQFWESSLRFILRRL